MSTQQDKITERIDETLRFYSAGLDAELEVAEEKPDPAMVELMAQYLRFTEAMVEALKPAFEALGRWLTAAMPHLQPLVDAAERHRRTLRVYRRWNEPTLRAQAWETKRRGLL